MITQAAIDIAFNALQKLEGFVSIAKPDEGGILTNGFGNTHNVSHEPITIEQALADLKYNIFSTCTKLVSILGENVILKLNDFQQAALIIFAFNVGFNSKWRLVSYLKAFKFDLIPNELMRFDHVRINGKLVEDKGLENRRKAECLIWNKKPIASIRPVSNVVQVYPEPIKQNMVAHNHAVNAVISTGFVGAFIALGDKLHLSPVQLACIVGIVIGCAVVFAIAFLIYMLNPIHKLKHYGDEMSPAFQTALTNLLAAAAADKAKAVAAVQVNLDAANATINQLQTAVNTADADDTNALTAATAQIQANGLPTS